MTHLINDESSNVVGNSYTIAIEEGTQTDTQVLFYAISSLITWIACSCFVWILCGYFVRNKQRLSSALIAASLGVLLFSWMDAFIILVFKTNVFVHDAIHVMQYQCSSAIHVTALCYGLYRYSLYMFYLIRIRHFFRGTAHEFRRQKFIASSLCITLVSFCLIVVLVLYVTPTIIHTTAPSSSDHYTVCYPSLNTELREEILVFLIIDVFISLYLTWIFVIKSRALLALEHGNRSAMEEQEDDDDDDNQNEDEPLTNNRSVDYGVDNSGMPSTYFVDEQHGGLRDKSVRRLMLRTIYLGMLAMITTWVHLALRFIECANIACIETLINSMCVLLSFDITADGLARLCCWCRQSLGHSHGYGRSVRPRTHAASSSNNENGGSYSRPATPAAVKAKPPLSRAEAGAVAAP